MRFIRKNGRIIPIKDTNPYPGATYAKPVKSLTDQERTDQKRVTSDAHQSYATTAELAATGTMLLSAAAAAKMAKSATLFNGLAGAGVGVMIGNFFRQMSESNRIADESNGDRSGLGEFARQLGSEVVGANAGSIVGGALVVPMAKGMIRGRMYAKSAARNTAQGALDMLRNHVKPRTAQFAEWRKFRNAKFVKSTPFNPIKYLTDK